MPKYKCSNSNCGCESETISIPGWCDECAQGYMVEISSTEYIESGATPPPMLLPSTQQSNPIPLSATLHGASLGFATPCDVTTRCPSPESALTPLSTESVPASPLASKMMVDDEVPAQQTEIDTPAIDNAIGIATWNVAHFSDPGDKKVNDEVIEKLSKLAECKQLLDTITKVSLDRYTSKRLLKKTETEIKFNNDRNSCQVQSVASLFVERQGLIDKLKTEISALKQKDLTNLIQISETAKNIRLLGKEIRIVVSNLNIIFQYKGMGGTGIPTETIKQLEENLKCVTAFKTYYSKLHSPVVLNRLKHIMEINNGWLDMIILQEVNDPHLLVSDFKFNNSLGIELGPLMESRKGSHGQAGQKEYYPLIYRKTKITVEKILYAQNGQRHEWDKEEKHQKTIPWDKKGGEEEKFKTFRPIIAYQVTKNCQGYLIGVVHTSPAGEEFERKAVYAEIENDIKTLKKYADENNLLLIIGGDFYLTAEAVVKQKPDGCRYKDQEIRNTERITFQAQIDSLGLTVAQPLTGTNSKINDVQIADFFIHTMKSHIVGLMHPEGKLAVVDTEIKAEPEERKDTVLYKGSYDYLRHWEHFSDHAPVGGIFFNEEIVFADILRRHNGYIHDVEALQGICVFEQKKWGIENKIDQIPKKREIGRQGGRPSKRRKPASEEE